MQFFADAKEWCQGRIWIFRILMWIWFVYLTVNHLRDWEYQGLLGGLNLGIHELGHLITLQMGEFICVLSGSLTQCLVPLLSFIIFYRQEDYFALAFSFAWLGNNLYGVATYVADARMMEIPLVTPFGGDEPLHDWNYLLGEMGLLEKDDAIAFGIRIGATLCMALSIAWGAQLLYWMIRSKRKTTP